MSAPCGHSACRQNWIDTGEEECVKARFIFTVVAWTDDLSEADIERRRDRVLHALHAAAMGAGAFEVEVEDLTEGEMEEVVDLCDCARAGMDE